VDQTRITAVLLVAQPGSAVLVKVPTGLICV